MRSVASERLLETLNWWKALNYRREKLMPITHPYNIGPHTVAHLARWRNYERMVLDNNFEHLDFREWLELPSQRENFDFLATLEMFPCELFEWNRKSRRVYHLPASLQYLLIQGRYERLRWEDVLWPYDSIVLTLEQPLEIEDAPGIWSYVDAILVAHIPILGHGKTLRIRLLRRPSGTMLGIFPQNRRNLIERFISTADTQRAVKAISATTLRIVRDAGGTAQGYRGTELYTTIEAAHNIPQISDHILIEPEHLIEQYGQILESPIREEDRFRLDITSMAARLVVGWALYMGTVSSNAFQNVRPSPAPRMRGAAGIITSPEHICTVLVNGRLDPSRYVETPEHQMSSTTFKRPHWRRGHKKRERGASPNAPKTVRVPPILIRKDLVPIFGIISGTATWIVDDE